MLSELPFKDIVVISILSIIFLYAAIYNTYFITYLMPLPSTGQFGNYTITNKYLAYAIIALYLLLVLIVGFYLVKFLFKLVE